MHQREWLSVVVLVHAFRTGDVDIVADDDGPVVDRHVLQLRERVYGRVNVPGRAEMALHLTLQCRADAGNFGKVQ
jgi:hypothetical protein